MSDVIITALLKMHCDKIVVFLTLVTMNLCIFLVVGRFFRKEDREMSC